VKININNITIFSLFAILCSVVYLDILLPIFVCIVMFLIGYILFYKNRLSQYSNFYIFSRSFIFLTFLGLLNVIDNYNYTGEFFGFGNDDRFFFNNITGLIKYGFGYKYNIGLYEHLLYFPAKILSYFISRDLTILDLLPINWFIGAIIPVLINSVSKLLFKTTVKFQILLLALLINNKYYDTIIHLYRDGLLYVFLLIAIITFLKRKYILTFISVILTSLLRSGHAILLVFFIVLNKIFKNTLSNKILTLTSLTIITVLTFQYMDYNIIPYTGQYQYIEKRASAFSDYSLIEFVEFRKEIFSKRSGHQSDIRQKSYGNNIVSILIGSLLQMFYPITFHFPYFDYSYVKSSIEQINFTFIAIIKWFSIIAWIWIIPLMILGFKKCYKIKENGYSIIIFYLVSLLTVTFISMQSRHGLIFVILNPIICQLGYNLVMEFNIHKNSYKKYKQTTFALLVFWNIFRWM